MNDNNIKINLTADNKKKILIAIIVVMIISIPISIISMLVMKSQTEADIAAHSISIDNAEGGEITVDCNIVEGSRNCEKVKISGTYTNGRSGYIPVAENDDVEISLKGDNGFYLSYNTTLESSTADIQEKAIKICFGSSWSYHYCSSSSSYPTYNLIVNVNVSESDRQKVKALEEQEEQQRQEEERKKQEEEEARKAEEEARKAEEEARKAERQASSNSTSSNTSSSSGSASSSSSSSNTNIDSTKSYILATIKEGEKCPSNVKFCNIAGKSEGYPAYNYGLMRGKLINNSGKNYSYLQITADIYNSAGSKIGSCWGNISGLKAGETWEYEAYCDAWASGASIRNGDVSGW